MHHTLVYQNTAIPIELIPIGFKKSLGKVLVAGEFVILGEFKAFLPAFYAAFPYWIISIFVKYKFVTLYSGVLSDIIQVVSFRQDLILNIQWETLFLWVHLPWRKPLVRSDTVDIILAYFIGMMGCKGFSFQWRIISWLVFWHIPSSRSQSQRCHVVFLAYFTMEQRGLCLFLKVKSQVASFASLHV